MKKRNNAIYTLCMIVILCVSPVIAYGDATDDHVRTLEKRIERLEELLEKSGVVIPGEAAEKEGQTNIGDRITLSGVLEVEASYAGEKLYGGGTAKNSDIVLATLGLGLEAAINDRLTGNIVLLWEEDDTEPIDVDEGSVTWAGNRFDLTAGRFYMPFGTFDTHFISDPLTHELGETQQSGLQVSAHPTSAFQLTFAIANGDVDRVAASDNINDYGLRLDFSVTASENRALDFSVQYYSDIADTDGELLGGTGAILNKRVGGLGLDMDWSAGSWSANSEYIGALGRFDARDLDVDADGSGDRPAAWNLEVARVFGESFELALKYEGTSEYADFPKSQYGLGCSWTIGDDTMLSAEYLYGTFDSDFSPSGVRRRQALTTQLAVGF